LGIWYADHRDPTLHRTPTLLIHGAGGTHLDWPAELRRLPEANALIPDLPGHGRSRGPGRSAVSAYAADMTALLDDLRLDRVFVLGFSMGAAVALLLALHHRARVAGLILIGGSAYFDLPADLLAGLETDPEATARALVEQQWAAAAAEQVKRLGLRRLLETDSRVLLDDYRAVRSFDVRGRLAAVQAPTLIIGGTADRVVPFAHSEDLHRQIAGSTLVSISGGGHMLALEQPKAVADAIRTWLLEVES
jgi:pimeloyl-ACP methyl ester carboxylesterase